MSKAVSGTLRVLVVGAGPIGLAYGHLLSRAGATVSWSDDGRPRPGGKARVTFNDWGSQESDTQRVRFAGAGTATADLVLVAVGAHSREPALDQASTVPGQPPVVVLGQHPLGLDGVPPHLRDRVILAFPGVYATRQGTTVEYVRMKEDLTTILSTELPVQRALLATLGEQAVRVADVADPGWFAYRAMLSTIRARAVARSGGTGALRRDGRAMARMVAAMQEGVAALRHRGTPGWGLAQFLGHSRPLTHFLKAEEANLLRGGMGDRLFGAYARDHGAELDWLAGWALTLVEDAPHPAPAARALLA